MSFFEIKYLIVDSFYSEKLKNNYSYRQSAGICYEDFSEHINNASWEGITVISTIMSLKIRHKIELTKDDLNDIKYILELSRKIKLEMFLTEIEMEYLEEDLQLLAFKLNEIEK